MIKDLIKRGDHLFSKKQGLLSLWQEIADVFYPERAQFTVQRDWGDDLAAHLTTSYTMMVRRDLGNNLSAMIRPQAREWFKITAGEDSREDTPSQQWLEWATKVQRRAMYDARSQFVRATREGDHDYVTFGNAVLSLEPNRNYDGLLYRCWHLRDVAWCEDDNGKVYELHRKWRPTTSQLVAKFGEKCHQKVKSRAHSHPYEEVECRHVLMKAEDYNGGKKFKTPYVSIYIDVANNCVLEEIGIRYRMYIVPRWQTISGSPYAYSPAAVAGLPDARLIQAMSLVLLEAGQKAVDPPLVATQEAIQGGVNWQAGGLTWVDREYDERLGAAVRPMNLDYRGLPVGFQMKQEVALQLQDAFYLNKIALPPIGAEMTAYEAQQRVAEYTRQAMPVFEPFEHEYNAPLCEDTFELMMQMGAFGDMREIPQDLQGKEISFHFESPLMEAEERSKGQTLLEAKGLLAQIAEVDQSVVTVLDAQAALRDALKGIGAPAKWLHSEMAAAEMIAQKQAEAQQAQMMQQAMQGAQVAKTAAEAGQIAGAMQ
jgi:NifU-like protein involved in Fe-S cluster formation